MIFQELLLVPEYTLLPNPDPRSKRTTDGKSLFELMLFGANKGDKVIIKLKSEDKEEIDDLIKTLDRLIPGFYDSE